VEEERAREREDLPIPGKPIIIRARCGGVDGMFGGGNDILSAALCCLLDRICRYCCASKILLFPFCRVDGKRIVILAYETLLPLLMSCVFSVIFFVNVNVKVRAKPNDIFKYDHVARSCI